MTILAYTQHLFNIVDLFGNLANCKVGIYTFIVKNLTQVEVGYRLLNVAKYVSCTVLIYFWFI